MNHKIEFIESSKEEIFIFKKEKHIVTDLNYLKTFNREYWKIISCIAQVISLYD